MIASDLAGIILLTNDGALGDEQPLLINPRFVDPEPHLIYQYTPSHITPMVYVIEAEEDEVGEKTISILDLNRYRKNKKINPINPGITLCIFFLSIFKDTVSIIIVVKTANIPSNVNVFIDNISKLN